MLKITLIKINLQRFFTRNPKSTFNEGMKVFFWLNQLFNKLIMFALRVLKFIKEKEGN